MADHYGLSVAGVEGTELKLPRVEQNQETDFQLLTRLASHNGFEFFVFQDSLYFKKPASNKSADITLEWGKGRVSFSPEINLAKQVKKVEVYGWNPKTKEPIIGSAGVGDEPGRDGGRASGGELLQSVVKGDAVHRERLPVYSQQEADRRARGKLKKASEDLLKGRGESIGIPELLADKNIELKGLGKLFNRIYYIEKTQHTVTSAGYKTTFNVKETTV
jgi:phage protein D